MTEDKKGWGFGVIFALAVFALMVWVNDDAKRKDAAIWQKDAERQEYERNRPKPWLPTRAELNDPKWRSDYESRRGPNDRSIWTLDNEVWCVERGLTR
jgi:hypothetical protein